MTIIIGALVLWLMWKLAWKLLKWILVLAVLAALAQGGCHDKTHQVQKPIGKAKVMHVMHNQ